jgi:hypothetical protein
MLGIIREGKINIILNLRAEGKEAMIRMADNEASHSLFYSRT